MTGRINLSPLGTAREAVVVDVRLPRSPDAATDQELLSWFAKIAEPLKALYGVEFEVALIAWELARWQPGLGLLERQALIVLVLTVIVHLQEGSTRIRLRGDQGRSLRLDTANRLLDDIDSSPATPSVAPLQAVDLVDALIDSNRLAAIVGTDEEFKPLIITGDHLYIQKMHYLEDQFVKALHHRLDVDMDEYDPATAELALRDVLEHPASHGGKPLVLTEEQAKAVRAATSHPMTIISGGPGTGKTTIILSILRTLRRLGVHCQDVALAAPTGKAANRMGEAISAGLRTIASPTPEDLDLVNLGEAQTLHRLLGYSQRTGRFLHHANNRLAGRIVIVDEGSMIDLALMERLIRSLRDGSRFILLGDAHQLPSVEAGDVLRDLITVSDKSAGSPRAPFGVWLEDSHRMRADDENGKNILAVAQAFDRGETPVLAPSRTSDATIIDRGSVAAITFGGVEFFASGEESTSLDAFLDRWHRDLIRPDRDINELPLRDYRTIDGAFSQSDSEMLDHYFRHWEKFRILCMTRVSQTTGADRINAALHQRLLDALGLTSNRDHDLTAGEPVMMQVNDYGRGIFNGDQGLILHVADRDRPEPMAVFRRGHGFVAFHVDALWSVLTHSYALTVHKAQGSEFDTVALILPDRDLPITTREILYTALTRSRQSVVIVGSREILEAGIRKTISRDTGIVDKLRIAIA